MSSTNKDTNQRGLFDDTDKNVHKRRVNQKNLQDIYMDEINLDEYLPERYRAKTKENKPLIK